MSNKKETRKAIVVLGAHWGDEGKRRLVDILAGEANIVCRFQSGTNAGHTGIVGDLGGIIRNECISVIGNGALVHLPGLLEEIANMGPDIASRLLISDRAHLVFDFHQTVDLLQELERGEHAIGTTGKGIGPAYSSKIARHGIRLCELLGDFRKFSVRFRKLVAIYLRAYDYLRVDIDAELIRYKEFVEQVKPFVTNTVDYVHDALKEDKKVIVEAANGTMLDVDFGTYPFVTSSNCTIGGVCTGLGLPPNLIGDIYGVVKAYMTRVGSGPFPTEQTNDIGKRLQAKEAEFGKKGKLAKRCGWLDLELVKYTTKINGFTALAITKLDILDEFDQIQVGVQYELNGEKLDHFPSSHLELGAVQVKYTTVEGWKKSTKNITKYEDLPTQAKNYIKLIEEHLDVPVKWIGVGPGRESMIQVY
jgi:adenylosuccinate synthase